MTAKRDTLFLTVAFGTTLRFGFLLFSLLGFNYDGVHYSLIALPTLFCQVLISCAVFSTLLVVLQQKGYKKISIKAQLQGMLQLIVLIGLGTGLSHMVLVLFGAALVSVVWETLHVACLLVATVILPSAFLSWPNVSEGVFSLLLDSEDSVVARTLRISSLCSVVGCWLGAIPIPLDWDRPWQEWPITCVVGTFAGSTVGLPVGYAYATYLQRQADKVKLV